MTRRTVHEAGGAARTKGREIVAGLHELADALRTGEPLEARFTVRTYKPGRVRRQDAPRL